MTGDSEAPRENRATIEAYYRKHRPDLRRTFRIIAEQIDSRGYHEPLATGIAHRLTLASAHLYLPTRSISLAHSRNELEEFATTLYALSRARTSFARLFVDAYAGLRFALADVGPVLAEEATGRLAGITNVDEVLSFCLRSAGTEQCLVFLRLFGTMAEYAPQSVPAFFDLFERVRKTSSWRTIRDWIARGVDLISSSRTEEGVAFLLGLSRESRDLLGMRFAVLGDRRNVLHIYCTSFGGRVYGIHELTVSIFGLRAPYTDGAAIFLPDTIDIFSSIESNESAYTVIASTLACMVQYGTFDFDEGRIDFAEELQSRYGTVLPSVMDEVEKRFGPISRTVRERATGEVEAVYGNDRVLTLLETPHEQHWFRYPTPDLIRELFSLAERVRVSAAMGRAYPGYEEDISMVNRAILASLPPPQTEAPGFAEELPVVLDWLLRLSLGAAWTPIPGADRVNRVIDTCRSRLALLEEAGIDVHTSARHCFAIYNALYDTYPVVAWCAEDDVRRVFGHRCLATVVPEIVADVTPTLLTGRVEQEEFVSEADPEEEEIDLTSLSRTEKQAHDLRQAILSGNVRVYQYPEYDIYRGSYQRKHCTLYESSLEPGSPDAYLNAIATNRQTYKKLRKRFLAMQPDALSIQRRWLVGEEMDVTDANDYVTDLMRGASPDEKIYIRRNRNDRSIAAMVLVDASSSTEELVNGNRIIDIERTALSLLGSVLSIVGDSFAIYTFFGMGRRNVFVSAVKRFEEGWSEHTWSRIDSISANASNRDGCAIRHAAARLLEQDERTRLLILLSDGIPADAGYGSGGSSETNAYAIEDTRRAIVEARMQGIVPYCITIDRNAREYTPRLYGEYHYTVLADVTRLPEKLSSLYLRLTG